jgi:hypothetical protein
MSKGKQREQGSGPAQADSAPAADDLEPVAAEQAPELESEPVAAAPRTAEELLPRNRAAKGRVRCRAVSTVTVDSMPVAPGELCWVPQEQARRMQQRGALEILS